MPFRNRSEAGRRLAIALAGYKEQEPTILALPRGAVAVAAELAAALEAPLDLILVRKVGVPFQPELAMGAVADGGGSIIVRNEDVIDHVGIDEAEFKTICDSEFAEIKRRRERYLGNRERAKVTGRTAIEKNSVFGAIGFYYRDFRQVSDEEVIEILQRFPAGKLRKSSLAEGVTRDGPKIILFKTLLQRRCLKTHYFVGLPPQFGKAVATGTHEPLRIAHANGAQSRAGRRARRNAVVNYALLTGQTIDAKTALEYAGCIGMGRPAGPSWPRHRAARWRC